MTITLADANAYVEHFLAGSPAGTSATGLSNEAGQELMNLAAWLWAEAVSGTADFTDGEDTTPLPSGFLRFTSTPRLSGGSETRLELVSVNRIETLRIALADSSEPHWAAVIHKVSGDGVLLPYLEIYPTPSADATPGVLFTYARGWSPLAEDTDILLIPSWIEPLYREVLRAVARGWEDDLPNPLAKQQLLDTIRVGPTFMAARATDRSFQQSYGPVRRGVGAPTTYGGAVLVSGDGSPS